MPYILGLTGSIAMGKSTVSEMFLRHQVPVQDSDRVVHRLYNTGGAAVPLVEAAFPGVTVDGAISRELLSKHVVGNQAAMTCLESIVHPLVRLEKQEFLEQAASSGEPLVVLDIPLLYETGAEVGCDAVAVVSAPLEVQRERALSRPGMTPEKLQGILARQLPDAEKRQRADYVIDTSLSLEQTEQQVVDIIEKLRGKQGAVFDNKIKGKTFVELV